MWSLCAGKFTPLDGWFFYDAFEALQSPPPTDVAPLGCRYDNTIQIFGKQFQVVFAVSVSDSFSRVSSCFQDKLLSAKTFVIGCGALGCELLKNYALLGVACGPDGLITATDNDRIEVSNLNRQFLFRENNVGQGKSATACAAARVMNPALNVRHRLPLPPFV